MLNEMKHLSFGQFGHCCCNRPCQSRGEILRFAQDDRRWGTRLPVLTLALLPILILAGCSHKGVEGHGPEIAVTNSYLQCVVQDLCGPETEVMCLAPPGMCPGHFDIAPASVKALRNCRMLLLFDFQQKVEATLGRLKDNGLKTFQVTDATGLCVPDTYLSICQQVARFLSTQDPERAGDFEASLAAVKRRTNRLSGELRDAVKESGTVSAPIFVSNHQAAFARWLGLDPVATFVGSDTETIADIDHSLKQAAGRDVRFVIANLQEGTALAKALAERLGAEAVIFSNFPLGQDRGEGFDQLLRDNVAHLVEAARR